MEKIKQHKEKSYKKGATNILKSIETKLQQNPARSCLSINNTRSGTLENMTKSKKEIDLKNMKTKVYESMDWEKIKEK